MTNWNLPRIADALDMPMSTVYHWLRRLGTPTPGSGYRLAVGNEYLVAIAIGRAVGEGRPTAAPLAVLCAQQYLAEPAPFILSNGSEAVSLHDLAGFTAMFKRLGPVVTLVKVDAVLDAPLAKAVAAS